MGVREAARALVELGERIALQSPGDGVIDERMKEEVLHLEELARRASVTDKGAGDKAPQAPTGADSLGRLY